ncbi:MAG: MotA/TolQ/ExbB proton channel family protein [SAR324 cluster bacterium]|nr:MotA/TolQ/ExbB proton channel family protein [SAR324 cluster bacterium]
MFAETYFLEDSMSFLEQMGLVGLPLLACAVIVTTIISERFYVLMRYSGVPDDVVEKILQHPMESIVDSMVSFDLKKWKTGFLLMELCEKSHLDQEEREHYLSIKMMKLQRELLRYLPLLKLVASIAPLLGLLGTILGMIQAFDSIATSHGPVSPALIANGISQAMLTTAAGLIIAIPSLIAYSMFHMRINSIIQLLTEQLNALNHHLTHGVHS